LHISRAHHSFTLCNRAVLIRLRKRTLLSAFQNCCYHVVRLHWACPFH
jgi:hypothetical protein